MAMEWNLKFEVHSFNFVLLVFILFRERENKRGFSTALANAKVKYHSYDWLNNMARMM
jgi:uncharacterized membrane protein